MSVRNEIGESDARVHLPVLGRSPKPATAQEPLTRQRRPAIGESDARERVQNYLAGDAFLAELAAEVRNAPRLKSVVVDVTHVCNLRCRGCYFFEEKMDAVVAPDDEGELDRFIERELARGTNFMTVVGGEPALRLDRLKKLHDRFYVLPFTNGLKRIPRDGFETMPIALSLWGGHETDTYLRGSGKVDVFAKARANYKDDPRVTWYYTTTPGNAHEIEAVVDECIANGNYLQFSYYEDHAKLGGQYAHDGGFARVRDAVEKAIDKYPDHILTTSYINGVATGNRLYDQVWGHAVCPTLTPDHPANRDRVGNGHRFMTHFRAYLPDLRSTRRCCVGQDHDCGACYNNWARITWIVINRDLHLNSKEEFTNWLTTQYLLYLFSGVIPVSRGARHLRRIHERLGRWGGGSPRYFEDTAA